MQISSDNARCSEVSKSSELNESALILTADALDVEFFGCGIVHYNVQGLHSNLSEWFTLSVEKATIFCFSEIWIHPNSPPVVVPGFQLFTSSFHTRKNTSSRSLLPGSCMFISSALTVHRPPPCIEIENTSQLLNVTCCVINCKHSYVAVACVYRSPSTSVSDCLVEFRGIISALTSITKHIVIVGDININLFASSTAGISSYTDLLSDFQLSQHVTAPTRVTESSATLIDHLLTTPSLAVSRSYQTIGLSDHCCQVLEVDIPVVRPPVHYVSVRSFRKCPWDEVKQSLSTAPWHVMDIYDDINDMWDFLISILFQCLDTYAPSHTVPIKSSRHATPWITPDLLRMVKQKSKAKHRAKCSGLDTDISYYKQLKNTLKVLIREAKTSYLNQLLVNSKQDPHSSAELWLGINNIMGRFHVHNNPIDGKLSLDDINNFFCTVAVTPDHNATACFTVPESNDVPDNSFQFKTISESDILYLLQHLDVRKSVGPDGLSSRFLKEVAEQIVIALTKIFNESLKSGNVPQAWKCSNVTPVHKSGSSDDPGNFRPISVVPVTAKILEKIVSTQLQSFLERNELLSPYQGAYRHGKLVH